MKIIGGIEVSMNGVNRYSFAETNAVDELAPVSTTIDKKRLSIITERIVKRIIDIIGGLVGTIALIPLSIIIYIARKILHEDDGPMFYEQLRIGKDGKTFRMYKYRSMVVGADEKLFKYLEENEEARKEYEEYKKLKNDPRVTKVGNFIRKTSLDEFPQFINVLKGEMSLIGNRPYLPREKEDMGEYFDDIVKTKPGLSGLWQISGRNDLSLKERLELERKYSNNASLKMDIKIFFKTFKVVFCRRGAK